MAISERDLTIVEKMMQYCSEIEEAHDTFEYSYDSFQNNSLYKNAVCLCIMQIGELSTHLSDAFKTEYDDIPWRQIRGMRNVVAHEYGHIDTEIVWETATENIAEIKKFCHNILSPHEDVHENGAEEEPLDFEQSMI